MIFANLCHEFCNTPFSISSFFLAFSADFVRRAVSLAPRRAGAPRQHRWAEAEAISSNADYESSLVVALWREFSLEASLVSTREVQ